MSDRASKLEVLAEWLYGVKMDEREAWVPEVYPANRRVPWSRVARIYKQSYRDEAQKVLARMEGPGVGGGGSGPRFGR